jgi:hypothetical protein
MTNVNLRAGIVLGGGGALLALFGNLATANAQAEFTPAQPHGITSTDTTVQPTGCIPGMNCGVIGNHAKPHHVLKTAFDEVGCIPGANCGPINNGPGPHRPTVTIGTNGQRVNVDNKTVDVGGQAVPVTYTSSRNAVSFGI